MKLKFSVPAKSVEEAATVQAAAAKILAKRTKVLDRWKCWCYYVANNFIA